VKRISTIHLLNNLLLLGAFSRQNTGRYPDRRSTSWNILQYNGISSNHGTVTDGNWTEELCTGIDTYIIAEQWCSSLARMYPRMFANAKRNPLVQDAVVSYNGRFVNRDTHAMEYSEPTTNRRPVVDLYGGHYAGYTIDKCWSSRDPFAIHGIRDPV
jgi:hypothetical protein